LADGITEIFAPFPSSSKSQNPFLAGYDCKNVLADFSLFLFQLLLNFRHIVSGNYNIKVTENLQLLKTRGFSGKQNQKSQEQVSFMMMTLPFSQIMSVIRQRLEDGGSNMSFMEKNFQKI